MSKNFINNIVETAAEELPNCLKNEILSLEQEELSSEWVSVKDGLPDNGVDVFIAYRDRVTGRICYAVGWADDEGRWFSNDWEVNFYGIIAWMPIKGYKPKED